MNTEDNNQGVVATPEAGEGEPTTLEEIKLTKAEYDELVGTKALVGSLKRELKDLKKPKEEAPSSPKEQPDDTTAKLQERLDRQALKAAQVTHEDDIALAKSLAKKWGMEIDEVVEDEDFKAKLDRQRTARSNEVATTGVKGDKGKGQAKETSAYWIAQGKPPTSDQVPDRKTRAKIIREMMASQKSSKTFYND